MKTVTVKIDDFKVAFKTTSEPEIVSFHASLGDDAAWEGAADSWVPVKMKQGDPEAWLSFAWETITEIPYDDKESGEAWDSFILSHPRLFPEPVAVAFKVGDTRPDHHSLFKKSGVVDYKMLGHPSDSRGFARLSGRKVDDGPEVPHEPVIDFTMGPEEVWDSYMMSEFSIDDDDGYTEHDWDSWDGLCLVRFSDGRLCAFTCSEAEGEDVKWEPVTASDGTGRLADLRDGMGPLDGRDGDPTHLLLEDGIEDIFTNGGYDGGKVLEWAAEDVRDGWWDWYAGRFGQKDADELRFITEITQ